MKVSWGDYSRYLESHKIPWFQTTNQLIDMIKYEAFVLAIPPSLTFG